LKNTFTVTIKNKETGKVYQEEVNCDEYILKEFEKKVTSNIIIIFDNLKYRNENKNFIDYKFIVKPFTLKNLFSLISNFEMLFKK